MGGTPVTHLDDDAAPLLTGTHKGANNASVLYDPHADFQSCGVDPNVGQLILNDTDGSEGVVTAVTEDTVSVSLSGGSEDDWDTGDTYIILKGATEDALLSTHYTDRLFGRKVTDQAELNEDGRFPEDEDLDDENFGPGQPLKKFW